MMPGAHGHVMLVEHLGQVVRVHAFEMERENAEPPLAGAEQLQTRDARQAVDTVTGQRLFVLEDVVAPECLDKVDRRAEPDCARYVRRAGLEPVRRSPG